MKFTSLKIIGLIGACTTLSMTSLQAETTNPSEKLMQAVNKFEAGLDSAYDDLSEEEQDTVVNTRIDNMNKAIDAAQQAIQQAQYALKYMSYGSTAVKSEVYTELNQFYAQLYVSEKQLDAVEDNYDDGDITNDVANQQLTDIINDVLGFIDDNKTDYATIIRDVLKNQLAVALPAAETNLKNLNTSIALYKEAGSDTTKAEKYANLAATNLATANDYYDAADNATDLDTQIQNYNNCAKYLTLAQAEIISNEKALDRLEK